MKLVAYYTCGYPDLKTSKRIMQTILKSGADALELGVPFSDPVADGPTLQIAHQKAIENKIGVEQTLTLAKELSKLGEIYIMSYFNPIMSYGIEKFCLKAAECGVKGVIIPDLSLQESLRWKKYFSLPLIAFLAPNFAIEDIEIAKKLNPAFVYYIARFGTTGERDTLPPDLKKNLKTIKKHINAPVFVGFGIKTPEHVNSLKGIADGVIVGSAIVKKCMENKFSTSAVSKYVKSLALAAKA